MAEQMATREEMVEEAVRRMRALALPTARIEHFEREGDRLLTEELPQGRYVLSSGDGRLNALAQKVEEGTGVLIFAGYLAHAFPFERTVGNLWTLFAVEPDRSKWDRQKEQLEQGRLTAFVIEPEKAAFCDLPYRVVNGALVRAEQ